MSGDLTQLSDEDLRAELSGAMATKAAVTASQERKAAEASQTPVDTTNGMSGGELFMAGMGKALNDPLVEGPRQMARTIWRKDDSELKNINAEREAYQKTGKELLSNWPAMAGNFVGKGIMAASAPARMPVQIGLQALDSFMSPGDSKITGSGNLLATRGVQGLEGAASQVIPSAALRLFGRGAGALTNRFTPEGQKALALDAAAERLGIRRNVGSLDQSSGLNAFETNLPGYARTVEGQSKAFTDAAKATVSIPSSTGRSYSDRVLEGEKLRQSLEEAGKNLKGVGTSLWSDLDSYVVSNGLPPVNGSNTQKLVLGIHNLYTPTKKGQVLVDKNPVIQRIAEQDQNAAEMLKQTLLSNKPPQMSFSDIHEAQAAVGAALRRAEKDASAPGASMESRKIRQELKYLYSGMMADVDGWGTKNPQAKQMFDEARTFWRDVVVPGAVNNKLVQKSSRGVYGMNPRGYQEPSQLYSDVVSNPRAVADLHPYMSQLGRDLTDTLSTMPDVSRSLITNTPHPPAPGMGTLTTMAGMAIGSPLQLAKGMISHAPGFQSAMQSGPAKKLYFSRDVFHDTPLGRVANAAAQEPQGELEQGLRGIRVRAK